MTPPLPHRPRVDPSLLHQWRESGFRTDSSLGMLLEHGATRWPTRPAVITERGTTTFSDLALRSSQLSRALLSSGVGSGDVVSWMLPTGVDAIAVAAAIWRIGAISSPIVPLYGQREITAVVSQVRPRAVVTIGPTERRDYPSEFDAACEAADVLPAVRIITDGSATGWSPLDDWEGGAVSARVRPATLDDPCLILFTSGTEAGPKGVVHSVSALVHELRTTVDEWGLTFRDTMVMASPMTHITGLLQGFMIPARVGASTLLMDRWNGDQCVELIEKHAATYMAGATPFLRELAQAYSSSGRDRSSLVQYCCGGAAVPPSLIRSVQELGISAYRAWGMTELPTATLPNELDPLAARSESDGRLAPGVELLVVDSDQQEVEAGREGELLVRGPEMMLGYIQDELNRRAFTTDGWLRTGDLGELGSDGFLRVTGRIKDIINRGGEKFSAREIEDALVGHPDVEAVAVMAVPGGRLGERVGAAVVSRRTDLSLEEIGRTLLTAGLARQKQPEVLALVPSLPTNPTGKIDRVALGRVLAESPTVRGDNPIGEVDLPEDPLSGRV